MKKGQSYRVCEYCQREFGTNLGQFTGTSLVQNMSLYTPTVAVAGMVPPATLPKIKSSPNCTHCHGLGYEYKGTYWAPCDRCIKKFGNMLVCRKCVGTGTKLSNGLPCKCLKHKIHPAKTTATTNAPLTTTTTTTTPITTTYTTTNI